MAIGPATGSANVAVEGKLGAQMLLWEYATALVGRVLGINPFDQPDVEAAKKAARALLDAPVASSSAPSFVDGPVEGHGTDWAPRKVNTVAEALAALVEVAPDHGYISVQAYLDRIDDASFALLRAEIAKRTHLQTTFGWGPRFLHSTGQYHKGGHQNGVFIQITGASGDDLEVPGRPYSLAQLQLAQALGDGQVLIEHGRPVLRLHLEDRIAGLAQLVEAVQEDGS